MTDIDIVSSNLLLHVYRTNKLYLSVYFKPFFILKLLEELLQHRNLLINLAWRVWLVCSFGSGRAYLPLDNNSQILSEVQVRPCG